MSDNNSTILSPLSKSIEIGEHSNNNSRPSTSLTGSSPITLINGIKPIENKSPISNQTNGTSLRASVIVKSGLNLEPINSSMSLRIHSEPNLTSSRRPSSLGNEPITKTSQPQFNFLEEWRRNPPYKMNNEFGAPNYDLKHGISGPLCLNEPTQQEQIQSKLMEELLEENNCFEALSIQTLRENVLKRMRFLLRSFVSATCKKYNLPEDKIKQAGGMIYPFGSYALGAHFSGADIDALCLVPCQIRKEDFFIDFYERLKLEEGCSEIISIPEAHVPVIKLVYNNIHLDLVFSKSDSESVQENFDLNDFKMLSKLDDTVLRSLNGPRVAREILNLVPNIKVFQTSLRFIKLWANRRSIYSNIMGYFGGVAYAILVARICQLFPNALPSKVILGFFKVLSKWEFPFPVLLKGMDYLNDNLKDWDPFNIPSDQGHRMPIITPTFPSMCTTHNLNRATEHIIKNELERGSLICDKIIKNQLNWQHLIKPIQFFKHHQHFIQLIAYPNNSIDLTSFSGFVESKIRHLTVNLERNSKLQYLHPYTKSFTSIHYCQNDSQIQEILNGNTQLYIEPIEDYYKKMVMTSFYLAIIPKDNNIKDINQLDLHNIIKEFLSRLNFSMDLPLINGQIEVNLINQHQLPNLLVNDSTQLSRSLISGDSNQLSNSLITDSNQLSKSVIIDQEITILNNDLRINNISLKRTNSSDSNYNSNSNSDSPKLKNGKY